MRRTESRDALHGEVAVGVFVWDYEEDGELPQGSSYLRGAVPEDSIAFAGFLQVDLEMNLEFTLEFYLGSELIYSVEGPIDIGRYPIAITFEAQSDNLRIDTEVGSRLRLVSSESIDDGRFALYVFYIHAEATMPDIIGPFPPEPVDELLMDDGASFVNLDDNFHILLDVA